MVALGFWTLIDSYTSFKKGVFREYRKMAPYVYYYKGDKWFVYKVIENAVLGLGMLGFAIWFWSMIL